MDIPDLTGPFKLTNSNIAMAYGQKHDFKRCFEHFRRAYGEAVANNNVGYLLSQEGKFSEAIAHYRRALAISPGSLRALLNMEAALRATGQFDEAENIHLQFLQAQKAKPAPLSLRRRPRPPARVAAHPNPDIQFGTESDSQVLVEPSTFAVVEPRQLKT